MNMEAQSVGGRKAPPPLSAGDLAPGGWYCFEGGWPRFQLIEAVGSTEDPEGLSMLVINFRLHPHAPKTAGKYSYYASEQEKRLVPLRGRKEGAA